MKRVGKCTVHIKSYVDGSLTKAKTESRTVYEQAGEFYCNWLGGHRRVSRNPDGTFGWEFHIRSLPIHSLAGFLGNVED
jgi:hypothetical protein